VNAAIRKCMQELVQGFDHENEKRIFVAVFGLISFLFVCGLFFLAADVLPSQFEWTASVVIVLTGVATFLSELRTRSGIPNSILFIVIALFAFVIEYVGVNTGFPFGSYSYTDVLGFRLMGVPIAIVFAWYATVLNTRRIAEWIHAAASPFRIAFTAGLLTLALDIVLEPTAAFVKGYWIWETAIVPTQNYVTWFVLGFVAVFAAASADAGKNAQHGKGIQLSSFVLFCLQFLLFAVTNVVHGFWAPTLAGFVFVTLAVFFRIKHGWSFAERLER
jgi:bisanhydrobacterioruberin hydratase